MSQLQKSRSLKLPSSIRYRPCTSEQRAPNTPRQLLVGDKMDSASQRRSSMSANALSTPKRYPSTANRRPPSFWPDQIPPRTPVKSFNPREYLAALSDLVEFASTQMGQVNLLGLVRCFNHAEFSKNDIAMRHFAKKIIPTLTSIQDAYTTFCDTRDTFDEEEIWAMILGLGEAGSSYWDVVEEMGALIEITEGEETIEFWKSLDRVSNEV